MASMCEMTPARLAWELSVRAIVSFGRDDLEGAVVLLERATELLDGPPTFEPCLRIDLLEMLSDAQARLGRYEGATQSCRAAASLALALAERRRAGSS